MFINRAVIYFSNSTITTIERGVKCFVSKQQGHQNDNHIETSPFVCCLFAGLISI